MSKHVVTAEIIFNVGKTKEQLILETKSFRPIVCTNEHRIYKYTHLRGDNAGDVHTILFLRNTRFRNFRKPREDVTSRRFGLDKTIKSTLSEG